MNKKFLSLVLALVMVLGTFGNVFAAAATDKKEVKEVPKLTSTEAKVQWLIDNKIVVGIADKDGKAIGDMDLKSPIRRDAVSKMLVFAIGEQDLAAKLQGVYAPFPDVKVDNIMNGFITAAASKTANGVPLIVGYEDGMFRPTNNVTYAELAKMLVVAIDKDLTPAVAKTYSWPQGWMDRAARLGIFEGLSIADANKPAVRSDAFAMIYNAFYQLKELKAVPSNETRGVISEHRSKDTLVLNQGDFKKEFKVNESTVFVNLEGKNQLWMGGRTVDRNYYVGSLVRVLANKDGVVTHIIEMGNPFDGVNEKNKDIAWVDLGKVELQKVSSFQKNADGKAVNLLPVNLGKDFVKVAKTNYAVTSKTEFYVADYDAQILTQVKDFAAAKAIVGENPKNVYLGYEVLPKAGGNEARIVVFNKADIELNKRVVRVAKSVSNQTYMLDVQAPGEGETKVEQFDLSKDSTVWPYNNGFDAKDVLDVTNNKFDNNTGFLIKHDKDPIVKINKFLLIKADGTEKEVTRAEANAVELIDKDEYTSVFALPTDYKAFFGKDLNVGAHVQYALKANKIYVLSEVGSEPLRGDVIGGQPSYLKTADVVQVNQVNVDLYRVVVKPKDAKKEVVYMAPASVVNGMPKIEAGKQYDFLLAKVEKNHEELEIVKAQYSADQVAADKALADYNKAINATGPKADMTDANYPDATKAKELKEKILDAVEKFGKLPASIQAEEKADLNARIEAYNKLGAVVESEKIEAVK